MDPEEEEQRLAEAVAGCDHPDSVMELLVAEAAFHDGGPDASHYAPGRR